MQFIKCMPFRWASIDQKPETISYVASIMTWAAYRISTTKHPRNWRSMIGTECRLIFCSTFSHTLQKKEIVESQFSNFLQQHMKSFDCIMVQPLAIPIINICQSNEIEMEMHKFRQIHHFFRVDQSVFYDIWLGLRMPKSFEWIFISFNLPQATNTRFMRSNQCVE